MGAEPKLETQRDFFTAQHHQMSMDESSGLIAVKSREVRGVMTYVHISACRYALRVSHCLARESFPLARYGFCWFMWRPFVHWHRGTAAEPFTELYVSWLIFHALITWAWRPSR